MNTRLTCGLICLLLAAGGLYAQSEAWSVKSGFVAREGHASVTFNGRMWVIGGLAHNLYLNDVWSSANGADWSLELAAAPWSPRAEHAAVVHNNRIWVTGGIDGWNTSNDVWSSSDGINWTLETAAAAWSARCQHTVTAFNGQLWLMGGIGTGGYFMGAVTQDAWTSTDGITWNQEATPPWPARCDHAAAVFANQLFVLGGSEGLFFLNDVWAFDGGAWTLMTNQAWTGFTGPNPLPYFGPRCGLSAIVYNNQLWAIAGAAGLGPLATHQSTGDVWSTSDGANWSVVSTGYGWSSRTAQTALAFNNSMWIIGGIANGWSGGLFGTAQMGEDVNDVWSSTDGMIWNVAAASGGFDGWTGRAGHRTEVFGNKLWVLGGLASSVSGSIAAEDDAWSSADGINWTEETSSAGWMKRSGHTSAVFNNQLWVLGGLGFTTSPMLLNDVWSSNDGVTWTPAGTGGQIWSARASHATVVFNGRLWVLGGLAGALHNNDVWSSPDGVNWTEETSAAGWSPRTDHSAVVLDNRIWVLGGFDGANYLHDVWSSADGINWTLETASPEWSKRFRHACTVADGRIWLAGGKAHPPGLWVIGMNATTPSEFTTTTPGVPSGEQSFIVSGANLSANLTVTPPAGFEIALCGASFQQAPLVLASAGGVVPATTIRVRYNPGTPPATGSNHTGDLVIGTVGMQRTIALCGTLNSSPVAAISVTGGVVPFIAASGTISAEQTYTVEAANLTADLTITASTSFEIALVGGAFQSVITLVPTAGTVAPTTIRARYNRVANSYTAGAISHASAGAGDQSIAVSSADSMASSWPQDARDVWSSADGINWVAEPVAPWAARIEHTLTTFNGGLWMLGGAHIGISGVTYGDMIPFPAEAWCAELPALQLASATCSVSESAGSVVLQVELNHAYAFDVSVDVATSNGTASAPGDYLAGSATVTIPAGQTGADFTITINDDQLDELDETLQVSLSSPQAATLGSQAAAVVYILDDDGAATVRFSAVTCTVLESGGGVSIDIELANPSGLSVQVDYATADLTATAGADYTACAGTVTIPAGQMVVTIVVPLSGDSIHEGDETFRVELSNPVNATLGAMAATDVTIVDDDTVPSAGFFLAAVTVGEADGSVPVEVCLSNPSSQSVTVGYAFMGGTATPGTDFSDVGGTVTFLPGEVSRQILVDIINDVIDEHDETFQVTLVAPVGCTLGPNSAVDITILRDLADNESLSQSGGSGDGGGGCASAGSSGATWLFLLLLVAGIARFRPRRD